MNVYRCDDGTIVKIAEGAECEALLNEAHYLARLSAFGIAPRVHNVHEWIQTNAEGTPVTMLQVIQQDCGDSEPVRDAAALYTAASLLLDVLEADGTRHGDLTKPNIIVRDGGRRLIAVDWQQSHPLSEPGPAKQPWSDEYLLMRTLVEIGCDPDGAASSRLARAHARGTALWPPAQRNRGNRR